MTCGRWARALGVACACKRAQGMTCAGRADRRQGRQASREEKHKSKRSGRPKLSKNLQNKIKHKNI